MGNWNQSLILSIESGSKLVVKYMVGGLQQPKNNCHKYILGEKWRSNHRVEGLQIESGDSELTVNCSLLHSE